MDFENRHPLERSTAKISAIRDMPQAVPGMDEGTRIMPSADFFGFPVVAHIESALPDEVKRVEEAIDNGFIEHAPDQHSGDKVYDSDPLD